MDNNYKKSYVKDNNKKYSTIIKKINCINPSVNINGDNSGDINVGKAGLVPYVAAEEGDLGISSFGGVGSGGERYNNNGYDDGFYKKDKGFGCIINNNINQDEDDKKDPCDEKIRDCFDDQLDDDDEFEKLVEDGFPFTIRISIGPQPPITIHIENIDDFCEALEEAFQEVPEGVFESIVRNVIFSLLQEAEVTANSEVELAQCIVKVLGKLVQP